MSAQSSPKTMPTRNGGEQSRNVTYFKSVKTLAKFASLYPTEEWGRAPGVAYHALCVALMSHMVVLLAWDLLRTGWDVARVAFLLANLVPYANAVNFACYFRLRARLLESIFRKAESTFQYRSAPGPSYQDMAPALKFAGLTFAVVTAVTNISAHQWTVVPFFISGPNGTRLLPVSVLYPFDVQTSPWYEIAYVLQAIAQTFLGFEYSSIGSLFAVFSILIGNQFEILCCSIRNASLSPPPPSLSDVANRASSASFTNSDDSVQQLTEDKEDEPFHGNDADFERDIKVCVEQHLLLKSLCRQLEQLFGPMLLAMLLGIMLMMCTSLYSFTNKFQLTTLEYTLAPIMHLAVFCYFGHNISTKGELVAAAAWESAWWARGREARRAAALLMQHAQAPIVLAAAGVVPLQLSTFVDVLKSSFSFLTLLRNMRDKQT